jgi:hypothetical protein
MDNYDNYNYYDAFGLKFPNPPGIYGSLYTEPTPPSGSRAGIYQYGNPLCHLGEGGSAPAGTALGTGQENWISPAGGAGVSNQDSITIPASSAASVSMQVNSLAFTCQIQSPGIYFPYNTPLGYTNALWGDGVLPSGQNEAQGTDIFVNDLNVPAGDGSATLAASAYSHITAQYSSSNRYWLNDSPTPFTYTPPAGGFSTSQNFAMTGHVRQLSQFKNSAGVQQYECVGDPPGSNIFTGLSAFDRLAMIDNDTSPGYNGVNGNGVTVTNYKCPESNPGLSFNIKVIIPDKASCTISGTPTKKTPTGAGNITVKFTMTNPSGGATWTVPQYQVGWTLNRDSTDPSGATNLPTTYVPLPSPAGYSSSPPGSFTATYNIDAPLNPDAAEDIYDGAISMYDGTTAFGTQCTWQTQVVRYFRYEPRLTATSTATPAGVIPADSALVKPGDVINLNETVKNSQGTNYPGDKYQWSIKGYTGLYSYNGTSPSTISFTPVALTGLPATSGSDPNGIYGTNTPDPVNKPDSKSVGNATFTVPAVGQSGAADGTHYCFEATVTPFERFGPGTDPTTYYKAYSTIAPLHPSGPGIYYGTGFSDSSSSNGTTTDGDYTYTIPVAGSVTTSMSCFEVDNHRSLDLDVSQGDVHAGGDLYNIGGSCSLNANAQYGGSVDTTNASYSQYVASAYSSIIGLTTGTSTTDYLSLGNDKISGNDGSYGVVCRPDMVKAALAYTAVHPNGTGCGFLLPTTAPCISGDVDLSTLTAGMYVVANPGVTIHGEVKAPITIFAPLGFLGAGVTVSTDVYYGSVASSINALPSLGVIQQGGTIGFLPAVKNVAGFYVAQTFNGSGGVINTCLGHVTGRTDDCPNVLRINGSLTANSIAFDRTGVNNKQGGNVVTEDVVQSPVLYLSPPPAFASAPNTAATLPQYEGEGLPIY